MADNTHAHDWFEYTYNDQGCRICKACDAVETIHNGEWEPLHYFVIPTGVDIWTS